MVYYYFMIDISTLRFSSEKGFGESYYILCPVCWNSSIKVCHWEDGSEEVMECDVCKRMEEEMSSNEEG